MIGRFLISSVDMVWYLFKRKCSGATFGAIKQKFGETLKSKKTTAQVNELLCKIIAHNITVLIHQMFDSRIVPDFITVNENT